MPDPRKTVLRPEQSQQDILRALAQKHLMDATSKASAELGMTGASFVILGIAIWGQELSELDQGAAARMLQAIGTIYDPAASKRQKEAAEIKRRKAVNTIFAALDLEMAQPAGAA